MTLAVIAGSGMGALAALLPAADATPFSALDGVGECTVHGHAGEIRTGDIGGRPAMLVLGRRHLYEGDPRRVDRLLEHLAARGVTAVLVTSAAGALHRSLRPGELVVVRDLVDRQNRERFGTRPVRARAPGDPSRVTVPPGRPVLDPALTARVEQSATAARVPWQRGTLVCGAGPAYETVAEVGGLQVARGDVATMSAAPEIAAANRLGLAVAALALVTNPCTGVDSARPSHLEVLDVGARTARGLARVVVQLIANM